MAVLPSPQERPLVESLGAAQHPWIGLRPQKPYICPAGPGWGCGLRKALACWETLQGGGVHALIRDGTLAVRTRILAFAPKEMGVTVLSASVFCESLVGCVAHLHPPHTPVFPLSSG